MLAVATVWYTSGIEQLQYSDISKQVFGILTLLTHNETYRSPSDFQKMQTFISKNHHSHSKSTYGKQTVYSNLVSPEMNTLDGN